MSYWMNEIERKKLFYLLHIYTLNGFLFLTKIKSLGSSSSVTRWGGCTSPSSSAARILHITLEANRKRLWKVGEESGLDPEEDTFLGLSFCFIHLEYWRPRNAKRKELKKKAQTTKKLLSLAKGSGKGQSAEIENF
jgi:hypothetical protein